MSDRKVSNDGDEFSSMMKPICETESPSAEDGISSVVASHYNRIQEKGLDVRNRSRIVYMRNFNNWIKSMLINEYVSIYRKNYEDRKLIDVLDMCCGKGGDLLKWKNNDVDKLICVDLAKVSVEQCKQRYAEMKQRNSLSKRDKFFCAEFVVADCTKVRINECFECQDQWFDIVSCQFSFHYSFESMPQAECMIQNAAANLRQGGFFIGTIPDANDIVLRQRQTGSSSFGNDVFKIQFHCDTARPFPLFGARYEFFLEDAVNCPEFLVHFPTFVKLAAKYGLRLAMKERFLEYYERMKEVGRLLLGRMQAFETYPPFNDNESLGKANDYSHADQYLKTHDYNRIGTLSKSEWEAASLYMVFAFIKEN